MRNIQIHKCQCPKCIEFADHPDKAEHDRINLFVSRLDEQNRRWFAAIEAQRIGHGGITLMSQITGIDEKTIMRGIDELENQLRDRPTNRVRNEGGGRPRVEKKRTRDRKHSS